MKRLLPLLLVAFLLLSGCGSKPTDETGGSLGDMFNSDSGDSGSDSEEALDPDDVPTYVGPTEIPSDLVPNE